MATIKLTKRNYLGKGYFHEFRDKDGNPVYVECTQEEYDRLGEKGGSKFNPVLEGHTWKCSFGGAIKVDSPTKLLGKNEYTEIGEEAHIMLDMAKPEERYVVKQKVEIIDDEVEI